MKIVLWIRISVLLATIILLANCQSGTEPENKIKDPREMTWTADTLSPVQTAIQLLPYNILVFAPNDIWLVCDSDVARGLLWQYDGKKWVENAIVYNVGGMRVGDLAGYSSSDLWSVGYSGEKIFLGHYDGLQWTRENDMGIQSGLLDATMDEEGNIWACGRNGIIMKYDKTKWLVDTLNINLSPETYQWLLSTEVYNGKSFVLISSVNKSTLKETYYYASGELKNWKILDSTTLSITTPMRWGNLKLYSSGWGKLFSVGLGGVWEYIDNDWKSILQISGSINGLFGANSDYVFALGDFAKALFYNGTNWEDIKDIFKIDDPYFEYKTGWTNGKETFIVGETSSGFPTKTVIWHGK